MNPFILGPDRTKVLRQTRSEREGRRIAPQPLTPSPLALRLGRLLIRMGSKLAHEDSLPYASKHYVN